MPESFGSMASNAPGNKVTLEDIGKKLGVSCVTVSLALRDRGRVSQALRRKVKRVAEEMGYRPDPMGRALVQYRRNRKMGAIHAVLAWINLWPDPKKLRSYKEFDLYWQGAYAAADAAGYRLEEFVVNEKMSLPRLQQILIARGIRGIIIPPHSRLIRWQGFDWNEFSAVRIGHSVPTPEVYMVAPDQVANVILAFNKIKSLGYDRIGFVCGKDVSAEPSRWFSAGFLMMQLNEPAKQRVPLLALEQRDPDKDRQRLRTWVKCHQPAAIFSDLPTTHALLESIGLKVPTDVGLAALSVLDGNADAGIDQNPTHTGRAASEILIAQINRNERGPSPDFRTATIKGKWVNGSSLPCISRLAL